MKYEIRVSIKNKCTNYLHYNSKWATMMIAEQLMKCKDLRGGLVLDTTTGEVLAHWGKI